MPSRESELNIGTRTLITMVILSVLAVASLIYICGNIINHQDIQAAESQINESSLASADEPMDYDYGFVPAEDMIEDMPLS